MESQISCIKMMKRDARTRGWVPLLTAVLLMIALPVSIFLQTENKIQWAVDVLPQFTETDMVSGVGWRRQLADRSCDRILCISNRNDWVFLFTFGRKNRFLLCTSGKAESFYDCALP